MVGETEYERHCASLEDPALEINDGDGVPAARGIGPVPAASKSPISAASFTVTGDSAEFYYTDSLTGCTGFVIMSGNVTPPNNDFVAKEALVIHDRTGDSFKSSKKELEKFIQKESSSNREVRLVWGNGVALGEPGKLNQQNAEKMVQHLVGDYPTLKVRHLKDQKTIAMSKSGAPVDLAIQGLGGKNMEDLLNVTEPRAGTRRFESNRFDTVTGITSPGSTASKPASTSPSSSSPEPFNYLKIDYPLLTFGVLPDLDIVSTEPGRNRLDSQSNKFPAEARAMMQKIDSRKKDIPLLDEIHQKLQKYYNSTDILHIKKWWALVTVSNELIEGIDNKKMRPDAFSKSVLESAFKDCMKGRGECNTERLVRKAREESVVIDRLKEKVVAYKERRPGSECGLEDMMKHAPEAAALGRALFGEKKEEPERQAAEQAYSTPKPPQNLL